MTLLTQNQRSITVPYWHVPTLAENIVVTCGDTEYTFRYAGAWMIDNVNWDGNLIVQALQSSANHYALRISGNFKGGAHGEDVTQAARLIVDGEVVNMDAAASYSGDEVTFIRRTIVANAYNILETIAMQDGSWLSTFQFAGIDAGIVIEVFYAWLCTRVNNLDHVATFDSDGLLVTNTTTELNNNTTTDLGARAAVMQYRFANNYGLLTDLGTPLASSNFFVSDRADDNKLYLEADAQEGAADESFTIAVTQSVKQFSSAYWPPEHKEVGIYNNLAMWTSADTLATQPAYAVFDGTGGLSINDNASVSGGAFDMVLGGWFYMDNKSASRVLMGKYSTTREYRLMYESSNDRLRWQLSEDGTVGTVRLADANNFGSPPTGTWVFVLAYLDSASSLSGISVNNGTANTIAASQINDSTVAFTIGRQANGAAMVGRAKRCFLAKPSSLAAILTAMRTSLWNNGQGKGYADLTAGEKTDWGLVSYWDNPLDEDLHGSNDLTNVGGVTSGAAETDNFNVIALEDVIAAARVPQQNTGSRQATYQASEQNSLPGLLFDGSDDRYTFTSFAAGTAHALVAVLRPDTATPADVVIGGASGHALLKLNETTLEYIAGGSSVTVAHGGLASGTTYIIGVSRSGTAVTFFLNGVQLGSTQTLGANNALTVTTLGAYSDGTKPFGGHLFGCRVWSATKTNAEMIGIATVLNNKWSVY